jgi:hypothetical protein
MTNRTALINELESLLIECFFCPTSVKSISIQMRFLLRNAGLSFEELQHYQSVRTLTKLTYYDM